MNQILHSIGLVSKVGIVKTSSKAIHSFLEDSIPGLNQRSPVALKNTKQLHTTQKLDACGGKKKKEKPCKQSTCKKKKVPVCPPDPPDPCARPDPCKKKKNPCKKCE